MEQFKDATGQDWSITINYSVRNVVKAKAGVDFFDIEQIQTLVILGDLKDCEKLAEVLFVLCGEQAEKLGLNPDQFAARFNGDVFEAACAALSREIANFFPKARRELLTKVVKKAASLQNLGMERANQMVDSDQMEKQMLAKLAQIESQSTIGASGASLAS